MSLPQNHTGLPIDDFMTTHLREPETCTYVPDKTRQDLVFKFQEKVGTLARAFLGDSTLNTGLTFDMTGGMYAQECPDCSLCAPLRYPVKDVRLSRSQQDIWNLIPDRVTGVSYGFRSAAHLDEHAAIAHDYYMARFPKHLEDISSRDFLTAPFVAEKKQPLNVSEVRMQDGRLVAGSINVETENAMQGLLYYYDPALMHLHPGRQMVLTLLTQCAFMAKDYLYVGEWNGQNRSLQNKTHIRPYELFYRGAWRRFDTPIPDFKALKP